MFKRRVALLLVLMMLLTVISPGAFAQEAQRSDSYGQRAYQHTQFLSEGLSGARVAATVYEKEAAAYILNAFEALGYQTFSQSFTYNRTVNEAVYTYDSQNIVAVKPGKSTKEIIVGAHYDQVITEGSKGAHDNASGVGAVLEVAERLKEVETPYTIRFIAFGAEEVGKRGSTYYASQMTPQEVENTIAMINLDSVIAGDFMYVYGSAGTKGWVRDELLKISDKLGLDLITQTGLHPKYPEGTTGSWSDHDPFDKKGIPFAYFESTNWLIKDEDGKYTDGYIETEKHGEIMHTGRDNLGFIEKEYPGRIAERFNTTIRTLEKFLLEVKEQNYIKTSNDKIALSEQRVIDVEVDLGYDPILENLEWTFGGKAFSEWKQWDSKTRGYTGSPWITFAELPAKEGRIVKAKILFDLVYGTSDLSGRSSGIRTAYPALIGAYDLVVKDKSNGKIAAAAMKVNAYDNYHTYDELKPAIDEIFAKAKPDRYLSYESIGKSVDGRDLHFVILAKDQGAVDRYLKETLPQMLEDPGAMIAKVKSGAIGAYQVPIFFNNIHPDESPGVDAQLDLLKIFATEDSYTYKTTNNNKEVIEETIDINEALENLILLFSITMNPDGRFNNTRENANGFDLNRDNAYQTQPETQAIARQIAKWTPLSFLDFHGFVEEFLIEPCTPPHDPNYEFDLLMDGAIEQAHLMGRAGIANTKYDKYIIPLFDYGDGWDDATAAYTATFAMHHGALGHTVEMPELNQDSNEATKYTGLAAVKNAIGQKNKLFANQLEYFRRGVEGIDSPKVDQWLVDSSGAEIGRPRAGNQNFFPEYYVLPVDKALQKNPLQAYNMVNYFLRNGIKVEKTTEAVIVGEKTYPAGSYIIPMRQAKRGLANTLLYKGSDESAWGAMYAEIVNNFPVMRGFDSYEIRTAGAFNDKTIAIKDITIPKTSIPENATEYVIRNTNNDAVKAVNKLLGENKTVKVLLSPGNGYSKGDFVVKEVDLAAIKDDYFLEAAAFNGSEKATGVLKPLKVAFTGSPQTKYVLKELGFNLVTSTTGADVVVDEYGNNARKTDIENGKHYIGIGRSATNFLKNSGLLPELAVKSGSAGYEGLLKAKMNLDSFVTAGYQENEYIYSTSSIWITKAPQTSKVLVTASQEDDFFVAGWWPGHEGAKGQIFALEDKIGNAKITLFAGNITNKAHPEHSFRLLSNAIFTSTISPTAQSPSEGKNGSGSGGGGGSSEKTTPTVPAAQTAPTPTQEKLVFSIPNSAITTSTEADGGIRALVEEKAIASAIESLLKELKTAETKTASVNIDIKAKTDHLEVGLPVKSVKDLVQNNIEFSIKSEEIQYRIPAAAIDIKKLEGYEADAILAFKCTPVLPNEAFAGMEVPGNLTATNKILELSLSVLDKTGDELETIKNFKQPVEVRISLANVVGDPDNLGVYYLNPLTGKPEFVSGKVADGMLVMKLNHYSRYAVMEFVAKYQDMTNHWSKKYVESMAAKHIVSGYPDGTYQPEKNVTRAEFAAMLVKALELPMVKYDNQFADVKAGDWYGDYVATAAANGILKGYEDNRFQPGNEISRLEMAVMLSNALKNTELNKSADAILDRAFSDAQIIAQWGKESVAKVYDAAILSGMDGRFNPQGKTTRAQAATAVYKLFKQ